MSMEKECFNFSKKSIYFTFVQNLEKRYSKILQKWRSQNAIRLCVFNHVKNVILPESEYFTNRHLFITLLWFPMFFGFVRAECLIRKYPDRVVGFENAVTLVLLIIFNIFVKFWYMYLLSSEREILWRIFNLDRRDKFDAKYFMLYC